MAELLLHVQGVAKSFPGVKALEDMHLDLRAGEVLALVGENGAGKSTLMKVLTGVYDVDEGEFFLNGERYEPTSPKHAQELGISIIHQEFNLMPDLTVAQNIFIGREPRGSRLFLNERRLNAQAQELIERLHLPLRPKELVGSLTVAKQQMVEIGKALSYDAKLLIMDEPTAALNDAEVEVLHGLIRRFVRPDTGVIYISHRIDELRRIADRITGIRDGHYVGTHEIAQTSMKEVISMMVGREISGEAKPVDVQEGREVVLEVSGLSTKDLLKDVSFELRKGEILGFAGLMGAGRTEVARAVVGADRIDGGTIRLGGREVRIHTPAEAARHRIGYLSEDRKQWRRRRRRQRGRRRWRRRPRRAVHRDRLQGLPASVLAGRQAGRRGGGQDRGRPHHLRRPADRAGHRAAGDHAHQRPAEEPRRHRLRGARLEGERAADGPGQVAGHPGRRVRLRRRERRTRHHGGDRQQGRRGRGRQAPGRADRQRGQGRGDRPRPDQPVRHRPPRRLPRLDEGECPEHRGAPRPVRRR
jgi:ABC-type branched-subunit amino acid transport system ATPase component